MINASFAQDCPACSRKLHVRVAYLGRRVTCQHCQAEFIAAESSSHLMQPAFLRDSLVQRADDLLRRLEIQAEYA
ncbi:MAG: response regulator [Planctomycetaceae bacterium]|nr:hypothetical protein [Planctomycetales bacterium]MCB9922505.1 response regulator [Planctomycetaceae bacterium]